MPMMPTTQRHCPTCGEQRAFEQPPCVDGHGNDCPEWFCIDCGYAVVVEFDVEVEIPETVDWAA